MRGFGYKCAALALVCSTVAFGSLKAQHVSGHTRDAASGSPLSGVVVALLDSAGRTLARTVSGADGEYRLNGDGSAALVRALRIGFRPATHTLTPASADAGVTVDLAMTTVPILLDTVAVHAQLQCPPRSDAASALALWNGARAALLASVVAREANPASLRVLLYDRAFEGRTSRLRQLFVADSVFTASQPMVSVRSGAQYQALGFMDDDSTNMHQKFYLPVAEVLLDSSFVENHCLSVRRDDSHHADELGLAFEPAKAQDAVVDVAGVIWIARDNPELRSLEFTYTNVPNTMRSVNPGGRIDFRTLPNGTVMSTKWFAHIPEFGLAAINVGRQTIGRARVIAGTHDIGGMVAEASWPDGSLWRDSLGSIHGRVVGNPGGAPIGGAKLRLIGTTFTTQADSTGEFNFPPTLKGPYRIEATDTLFAELGRFPRDTMSVDLGDASLSNVTVKVPARARTARAICASATQDDPSISPSEYILYGRVLTPAGTPASGAFVNVQWPTMEGGRKQDFRGAVKADSLGRFEFCGIPLATEIALNASRDTLVSSERRFVIDTAQHLVNVPLALTRVELASIPAYRKRNLTVIDGYAMAPLADVEVIDIFDDAMLGKTDARGMISLAAIPSGTTFLRLRKLGYEQRIVMYAVDPGDTKDIRAQLRTVTQLATVTVTAAASVSSRAMHDGFDERARTGMGHFIMPKDFDKASGQSISQLVSRVGIRLVSRGAATVMSGGHSGSGYCPVTIYIDGMVWWQAGPNSPPPNVYDFQADDFSAAEYYSSSAELPPEYNPTRPSPCGVLLLWRRDS